MNADTFRLNIFLESTRVKGHKKNFYGFLVATYAAASWWMGMRLTQAATWGILAALGTMLFLGSSAGKAILSCMTGWIPWSKFGYISLNVVGCESIVTKTAPYLFLHKNSKIGQIEEWLKCKVKAPHKVEIVWAGRVLSAQDTLLSVGIGDGSNVVAVFDLDNLDEQLRVDEENRAARARRPRRPRVASSSEPDFDFDFGEDEENVPSFIHDMMEDSDDDDDEDEESHRERLSSMMTRLKEGTTKCLVPLGTWLGSLSKGILDGMRREFGNSEWLDDSPPSRRVSPVVVEEIYEQPEESDTESDDECPSFLREMNSDDDDDDDDEHVPLKKPSVPLWVRLKGLVNAWIKVGRNRIGGLKVFSRTTGGTVRQSKARDVITLMEDEDEIRYILPCGQYHHCMSQSSLLGYMKNRVLVDKNSNIGCPVPECAGSAWGFADVCDILRERNPEFQLPVEEVQQVERELSANLITKTMNCQRCPNCELVLARSDKAEDFDCTCFSCEATFCWGCKAPWSAEFDCCMNPKCGTTWEFVAGQMLKNCPRKHLDHMANVPTLRACPECGQLITHVTACKHMRCSLCTTRFCFICMLPQKNGNWQCGYDANSCKLTEVQDTDALSYGRVARTNVLERVSTSAFKDFEMTDMEEFTQAKKQFIDDVMTSVRNPQFFD